MYGITLSDNGKKALSALLSRKQTDTTWVNPLDSEDALYVTVKYLEDIGLIKGVYGSGEVFDYRFTAFGEKFEAECKDVGLYG